MHHDICVVAGSQKYQINREYKYKESENGNTLLFTRNKFFFIPLE